MSAKILHLSISLKVESKSVSLLLNDSVLCFSESLYNIGIKISWVCLVVMSFKRVILYVN